MQRRVSVIRRSWALLLGAGLLATVVLSSSTSSATGTARVLDPGRAHLGRSHGELAGDWWDWADQFPLATNPITENGNVDCSRGQRGFIWFLAGTFGGAAGEPNPADRSCRIPLGRFLFIPLANSVFWVPEDGANVGEVRKKA